MEKTWTAPQINTFGCYTDMVSRPHLLIGGATGSGKSVVETAIIYSLLARFPFDAEGGAQFILLDPKRSELGQYKRLPHVLRYASEPDQMGPTLRYAMDIIDRRTRIMQAHGWREYKGGHAYIFVDEFADLMTTCRKECAPLVQRIAQIGRAPRVHLIICTQSPIAKVIPTEIRCNFADTVALRTRNAQDSRNLIGASGCELLPDPRVTGKGQGYYQSGANLSLLELPMIDPDTIAKAVTSWTDQGPRPGATMEKVVKHLPTVKKVLSALCKGIVLAACASLTIMGVLICIPFCGLSGIFPQKKRAR